MGSSGGITGGVTNVTPGDSTIVVGGTEDKPTIKANVGTTSGTVAAGNDSRFHAIGTTAGTVAAGNDSRFGKINNVAVSNTPTSGQILEATGATSAAWADTTPGGVMSVTAGNGTITIGGTASAPTVAATVGTASGTVAAGDDSRFGKVASSGITDATTVGKALIVAASATAGRTAIGAGTSNLALGTTSSTALAGNTTADAIGGVIQSAGIVVVNSGSDASTPRPAGVAIVYWIGTVAPTNAAAGDIGYGW